MSSYFRQQAPAPLRTVHRDYEYTSGINGTTPTPTSASAHGVVQNQFYRTRAPPPSRSPRNARVEPDVDAEEALLDHAHLRELHEEAEKMKALGNKHMAAQEYARAYNAYSAALQLAPVGPSSHVFLSNRAAALLSMKRYEAAATDAKRAIVLAPTFGKAHARLGQALYFLKDYEAAVEAYEEAVAYEPDNATTLTYLEKARAKGERYNTRARGDDGSVGGDASTAYSIQNSVATDHYQKGVVESGYRGITNQSVLNAAVKSPRERATGSYRASLSPSYQQYDMNEDDPDFDEALRIQQRAAKFLTNKAYRAAIEEYTAALFLVPDDPNLSPELHLGRAHALNGSRRHESAKNDARMAIRLNPQPAAFSTMAKSLFYMKDYRGAVEAFEECVRHLPAGETLGMFDKAYLQKAQAALDEEEFSLRMAGTPTRQPKTPIPKLPPPRFVPREQAMQSSPQVPPMPKQWPQQSSLAPSTLRCGPERQVFFLSEGLGIKLNRGPDGIVRVLSVTSNTPAAPVARRGIIEAGDVVREAAGVDIRRPITNIMWGDTVALIKMAARPIVLVVAKEVSKVPLSVLEEQMKALSPFGSTSTKFGGNHVYRPSKSSGDETVRYVLEESMGTPLAAGLPGEDIVDEEGTGVEITEAGPLEEEDIGSNDEEVESDSASDVAVLAGEPEKEDVSDTVDALLDELEKMEVRKSNSDDVEGSGTRRMSAADYELEMLCTEIEATNSERKSVESPPTVDAMPLDGDDVPPERVITVKPETVEGEGNGGAAKSLSLRDREEQMVGGEILFGSEANLSTGSWDNLRWMSYSGSRKIRFCQMVYRLLTPEKKNMFWVTSGRAYEKRGLAIYEEPRLILVLRRVVDMQELRLLLGLPDIAEIDNPDVALTRYWVVESAVDPAVSRLRLSPLTTPTSWGSEQADTREKSCFELLSPAESIMLSAVRVREGIKKKERSFVDSGAFLETTAVETALTKALCDANDHAGKIGSLDVDMTWKHQVILGTLHSIVLSGNLKGLEEAIQRLRVSVKDGNGSSKFLPTRVVDPLDENGRTPLYYACTCRMSTAVACLINSGARINVKTTSGGMALSHICASNLDDKSLSIVLSATRPSRLDPNELDTMGRTPMYVALVNGRSVAGTRDARALSRCLVALAAWGGRIIVTETTSLANPVKVLASEWRSEDLSVLLDHIGFRYPLRKPQSSDLSPIALSLGAFYNFPIHSALISLHGQLETITCRDEASSYTGVQRTIRTLLLKSFEPNERLEFCQSTMTAAPELANFVGFTPLQILAASALQLDAVEAQIDDDIYLSLIALLAEVGELLVKNGARISLDAPSLKRIRRIASTEGVNPSKSQKGDSVVDAYRSSLKIDSNKKITKMLGGAERLSLARKEFVQLAAVNASPDMTVNLNLGDALPLEDTSEAGGNNEKSCAICWVVFGALMNRKHKCRVSRRYICDECSTKRILCDGKEYRLSDGQFALARADADEVANEREADLNARARDTSMESRVPFAQGSERLPEKKPAARKSLKQLRLERLEAEGEADRNSLFGGIMGSAAKLFGTEGEPQTPTQSDEVKGLSDSLGQTRNALLERGDKLATLDDKSAKMVDASADFARMAKELRKKSEKSWFG